MFAFLNLLLILQNVCVFVDDVTVLEVLKFQVAYVHLVEEGSNHDVVQMSDGFFFCFLDFNGDFGDAFSVHRLCSSGPRAWCVCFRGSSASKIYR